VVDNELYKIFFEKLFFTGLREGEALALNWNDFKDDSLNITKTISKEFHNGKRVINTPKTNESIRKVKLDDELINSLNNLKKSYMNIENFENDWFIFGGPTSLAPTTIARKKDKYCELANVKK